jgi:beta-glucosidase
MTYGTPRNLGMLPEAAQTDIAAATLNTIVDTGRAAAPWSLSLIDATGEKVAADPAPATVSTAALRVARGGRNKQEDTLIAIWSGIGKASLVAAAGQPASFVRQSNDGMTLTLDLRVDTAPAGPVTLAMGSAAALGKVDLTRALKAAHGKGWTKISVALSCFRGADMGAVTLPMVLTSSGKLAVSLFSIAVAPGAGQVNCPAPEASKAYVEARPHIKAKPHHKAKSHIKARPHVKARRRHVR